MKRLWWQTICGSLLLTLVASASLAQPPGPPPGGPGGRMNPRMMMKMGLVMTPPAQLRQLLRLTTEQFDKVKAINQNFRSQMQSARQSGDFSQIRSTMSNAADDIQAVLTPAQLKEWQKLAHQVQLFRIVGFPIGAIGALKLTKDQLVKLRGIVQDAMQQFRSIPPNQRRTQMSAVRKQVHAKALEVLTAEQRQILAKYAKQNGGARPNRRMRMQ